ncbi:MAG: response regulator [Candidatus Syntropharchaeales archaeon]|nr:MAG: two-component system response regulator [Deltaproteobacteria bacterium]
MIAQEVIYIAASVLIIDDEETVRNLYIDLLEAGGHEVVATASDGAEGVEIFRMLDPKPAVTIIDYRMPRMNGIDAMREMMGVYSDVIFVFASADTAVKEEALRSGASTFLKKPFSFAELMGAIERFNL